MEPHVSVPPWVAAIGGFFFWVKEVWSAAYTAADQAADAQEEIREQGLLALTLMLIVSPLVYCRRAAVNWKRGTWWERARVAYNATMDVTATVFTVVVLWPAALYAGALALWWLAASLESITGGAALTWVPVTAFNALAGAMAWVANLLNMLGVDWPGVFRVFMEGGGP